MPLFRSGKSSSSNTNKGSKPGQPLLPTPSTESPDDASTSYLPEEAASSTTSIPIAPVGPLTDAAVDGAAPLSSSDYASKSREIMALYRALLELHADTVFDIPRVVVIGSQSSGKSSLVEAVTGHLRSVHPTYSNLCRCPMICTMSSNATSWSCTISLLRETGQDGRRLANPEVEPFGVVQDPSAVELQIRRAQAAILGPHRPASDFYAMSREELLELADDASMLQFSRNVVQVEVKDPKATDLTFVDLPGLIQNAKDAKMIGLVRELTEIYIRKPNTLIVMTMPMGGQFFTIQSVITKPDALSQGDTGARETWKAILEGRKDEHVMRHGYYCVRLPDEEERKRKISRLEAEELASTFFDTNAPWNTMETRNRFGIPNFVKNISELLIELIELKKGAGICIQHLKALPPVLDLKDPSTEVMLRISAFCKDIKDTVFGRNHEEFVQLNKQRYSKFKTDIRMTTPDFRPVEDIESSRHTAVESHCSQGVWPRCVTLLKGRSKTWEHPGFIPFEAVKSLSSFLSKLLSDHFGQFQELERYMRDLTFKEREIHREETRKVLEKLLHRETDPLWLAIYGQYPSPHTSRLSPDPWFSPRYPVGHQFPRGCFAYPKRRFAQAIDKTLFAAISKDTENGKVTLCHLLREDPVFERQREELKERKERLLRIKEKLDSFQQSTSFMLGLPAHQDEQIPETHDQGVWQEHEASEAESFRDSMGTLPSAAPEGLWVRHPFFWYLTQIQFAV
ncbi:P-loop containing nucleoside triphosphate hydrolase protein [Gymnopilus junonius]|uniref:P-loop containing nucleoside triphosphate hydrolase protein n=1 Tax=Gymnopilus junonius TaxID=109634 RepID=A0A9P5NHY2_GYMJU|nr:P-loop containing nucleoside triphosphate hydrolase protein [Gymnopilus junonius]